MSQRRLTFVMVKWLLDLSGEAVLVTDKNIWPRVVDLEEGIAMIVTDLHGDWGAYQQYRDRFLSLQKRGQADYFIITGDLIHYTGPVEEDGSLKMVLDVLKLQERFGEKIIYLLGNHELPHIYSITLQKGKQLYTPPFENALGRNRHQVLSLFDKLPFYVRSRSGVAITHAGATAVSSEKGGINRLFSFSHKRVWRETAESLTSDLRPSLRQALSKTSKQPYDDMVQKYFAVTGPDDPRYDHFLIGAVATSSHPDFQILWDAMFSRNEYQYGSEAYYIVLTGMLNALSTEYYPQKVLVAGHINCQGGHKIVAKKQIRLRQRQTCLTTGIGRLFTGRFR